MIDYAGAFVDRSDDELIAIFSQRNRSAETWGQLTESFFPDEQNVEILSDRIIGRLQHVEVNLVVACDKGTTGSKQVSVWHLQTIGFALFTDAG